MEFRFFGEGELEAAGHLLALGTPRQQAVLAALVVEAGRPVAVEALIDRVWDDEPPVEARNVLYSHVSRIRQLLRQAAGLTGEPAPRVERRYSGYVLEIDPDLVDLHRFRRLIERGRDPRWADVERAGAFAEALALWRGTPLAGIQGEWVAEIRRSWQRLRLEAALQWAQLELRLDRPTAVIAALPDLIAEYPLAEPLEELLMRALQAAGRDAEALERYAATQRRLADELGTDPGPELRGLHQAILRGQSPPPKQTDQPAMTTATTATITRGVATPAQLPPDIYGFTGRDSELHQLDKLLTRANDQPTAVAISAMSGTAGVGKTALAVHWAHRVRDQFPDGQLYVNLRGFDPSGTPVSPADAVRGFLDAFDVAPQRIPAGLEAQVGLYRSLLANRRVLILLDNARDAEQARPLLPGVPGCLAVVTSRNLLTGLIATAGAQPLALDLLTIAEARDLLARRLGQERVAEEPRAVDDIIDSCARLPLALSLIAARAAARPEFPLGALAEQLRDAGDSLAELASPDLATDPRAVFSWSYQQLGREAARLFRLLSLHPGPDISAPAAASLAGLSPQHARPLLAELAHTHLIHERVPGRYGCHDLLRAYAGELTRTHDSAAERQAATHRLLDHYLHTAYAAAKLVTPHRDLITLGPPQAGVTPEDLAGYEQAIGWFSLEHSILVAVVDQAANQGFDAHAWQLTWTMSDYFDFRGHWRDHAITGKAALHAAQRLGDPEAQARIHGTLALACGWLAEYDDAYAHLRHALDLHRKLGDQSGEAHTHSKFARILERQLRYAEALTHAEQALDLFRATGHLAGQAGILNAIGWYHALLGSHEQALTYCRQALEIYQHLDDHHGEAATWDSLGYAHHFLGHHEQAITAYRRALDLLRGSGDRYVESQVLTHLGEAQLEAGNHDRGRQAWRQALNILEELNHPDAEELRTRLHDFGNIRQ